MKVYIIALNWVICCLIYVISTYSDLTSCTKVFGASEPGAACTGGPRTWPIYGATLKFWSMCWPQPTTLIYQRSRRGPPLILTLPPHAGIGGMTWIIALPPCLALPALWPCLPPLPPPLSSSSFEHSSILRTCSAGSMNLGNGLWMKHCA